MKTQLTYEDMERTLSQRQRQLCAHCGKPVDRVFVKQCEPGAVVVVKCHGRAHQRYFAPTDRTVEDGQPYRWFSKVPQPDPLGAVTLSDTASLHASFNYGRQCVEYVLRVRDYETPLTTSDAIALLLFAKGTAMPDIKTPNAPMNVTTTGPEVVENITQTFVPVKPATAAPAPPPAGPTLPGRPGVPNGAPMKGE